MNTENKPQPATLLAAMAAHGVTVKSEFVPFSMSRNKGNKDPSLNWRVTVYKARLREPRFTPDDPVPVAIITTDYSAGCGHCPAYKAPITRLGNHNSIMRSKAIAWECENGKRSWTMEGSGHVGAATPVVRILPEPANILHSLLLDSDVLNYRSFEDWAGEFGYDPDSRKGEAVYRACMDIALQFRNGLGDAVVTALREAAEDF